MIINHHLLLLCGGVLLHYKARFQKTTINQSIITQTTSTTKEQPNDDNLMIGSPVTSSYSNWSGESKLSRPSIATTSGTSMMSSLSDDLNHQSPNSITAALAPQPRRCNDLSGFTINKFRYKSLGFYGREKELKLVKNILNKLMSGESPEQERQLLLISGYSGTGKTSLANNALKQATERLGGLFVRGKFDLNLRNVPYSGIASACGEICSAILQLNDRNPNVFQQICSQIKTELGSELALLIRALPVLGDIMKYEETDGPTTRNARRQAGENNLGGVLSAGESKNQFNFAFLRFIRTISQQFAPVVFVLDDLQWSDYASLDLLDILISDQNTGRLMVVGIFRSNEVDETHIFHRTMENLETKAKDKYFEMSKIEIGNLELDAVHEIIQEILSMDNDIRTLGLAEICYKKTHGNVFFLLQFLSMLKEYQLLQFNFGTVSWTWNEDEIESRTSASDNVVDLLKAKMTELSKDATDILKLASCLGSTFEERILHIVWERSIEMTPEEDDALITSLATLETDGYIIRSGESTDQTYSWAHDKIQEAASTLVPEKKRNVFAAKIGFILLLQLDEKDLDAKIFLVVDQLDRVDDTQLMNDDKARLDLARLNYRAAQKAISLSAFESAARYAARGIGLLPQHTWADHYDFMLNIYTIGAQAEGFVGNTETMNQYCKQVLQQEDRPIEDKFPVYNIWIDSLLNQGLLGEARDLSLEILKKFRCRFPKNSISVGLGLVSNVVRVKATMKSRDASAIAVLNDKTRIELMKILDRLATIFYMLHDARMPLVVFKSLNWTMKYGVCNFSAPAFALTGTILTGVLNDLQGGSKYGEQALAMIERLQSQTTESRTIFAVHAFIFPWTKPVRSLLNPLLRGYDIGLQTGDTESATWNIFFWLSVKYMIGSSLETLEADSLLYFRQMKALKRGQAVTITKYMRQAFLNLLGRDNVDHPTRLSGSELDEEELERLRSDPFFGPGVYTFEGMLFTYFGEYVQYADSVIRMGHDHLQKAWVGSCNNMWDTFLKGISCFAAARETGQNKYAKMGQVFRSKIKKWIDMGNPNMTHFDLLLDAEFLALKGNKIAAIQHYESAILVAARGGFQHDAALATERLGRYNLKVMGDREEAAFQLGESVRFWRSWGALAKVQHLRAKYPDLLP